MSVKHEKIARKLRTVLLYGRSLSPLKAEKKEAFTLSHTELITLQLLYLLSEDKVSVLASDLAEIVQTDRTRISHLLKNLAKQENQYVTKRFEPPSRLVLELTEKGKALAEQVFESDTKDLLNIIEIIQDKKILDLFDTLLTQLHQDILQRLPKVIEEGKKRRSDQGGDS